MPIYHFDSDDVRLLANLLNQLMTDINQTFNRLSASLGGMVWEGPARQSFNEIFQSLQMSASEQNKASEDLVLRLQQSIQRWEEVSKMPVSGGSFGAEIASAGGLPGTAQVIASGAVGAALGGAAGAVAVGGAAPSHTAGTATTAASGTAGGAVASAGGIAPAGGTTMGRPAETSKYVQRQTGNTCSLYAQGTAMNALGHPVSMDDIKKEGWDVRYFKAGPVEGSIGLTGVWDHYGIKYESFKRSGIPVVNWKTGQDYKDAAAFLENKLSANKAVIVGVEADALYDGIYLKDNGIVFEGHAVWVTGLNRDSSGSPVSVVINDSGTGRQETVPYSNFMNAWSSRSFNAVASEESLKE